MIKNLKHYLDFESPTESSKSGMGKGPGGWYFHNGAVVSSNDSKFGKYSLQFTGDTGNLSKFNQVKTRLCSAGLGWTFSFFFKGIKTVGTHRTILQLCNENDPDGRASHLVYVTPDNKMGGTRLTKRDWSDINETMYIGCDIDLSTCNDNEWHHMAVVGSGSKTKIYIDGLLACTYDVNVAQDEDNYLTVIGNRKSSLDFESNATQLFEYFDYFKFYDCEFSEEEILALVNEKPGLVRLRLLS
ncbi:MAG: hypothetical protein CME70_06015 [Halobacteriovorax sp.]|nr:hypothetical protein [Halobacteriovorax sp.]